MSNFKPSPEVLELWTSTRKAKEQLGDIFFHPRIYSTVGYNSDKYWVLFAAFIELASLLMAIFLLGFNPYIIIGAVIAILLDAVLAVKLHTGQKNINKYQCKLALIMYEGEKRIIPDASFKDKKETYNRAIAIWVRKKNPYAIALLLIATVKAFFGFIALQPYGIISFLVPPLFYLAAYVHIKHTGYWWAERTFRKKYEKEEAIFHYQDANGQLLGSTYYIDKENLIPIENIPQDIAIEFAAYANNHNAGGLTNDIILGGNNNSHKIIYHPSTKTFSLSFWGPIKDEELFQLVNNCGMKNVIKSFIGYNGLKEQKFIQPEIPK